MGMTAKIKKLKISIGYESEPPMCKNCANFSATRMNMQNSLYKKQPHYCKRYGFVTKIYAVCDNWVSVDGDVIDQQKN